MKRVAFILAFFEEIQCLIQRRIADGVADDRHIVALGKTDEGLDFDIVIDQDAAVAGIVAVHFRQGCRSCAKGAVEDQFQRSDAEEVVADIGGIAIVEEFAEFLRIMEFALLVYSHRNAVLVGQSFECLERRSVIGRETDKVVGADGSDAVGIAVLCTFADVFLQLFLIRFRHGLLQKTDGIFAYQTFVEIDLAFLHLCFRRDAGKFKSFAVGGCDMAAGSDQYDRNIFTDGIERFFVDLKIVMIASAF